ncbi:receptor-type tyrosine-protein kinase FLT3-like [Clarias gariepinus]|uniref:receptor-type tyrosine-protein kinase FLT3 n=1 Tax=Clarias gariepinus TaxID=13013 RepID=UPI00234CB07A|nr:receptor-type tyrosine-protein kinase FLT3 [Clarias gariepinus]
MQFRQDTLLRVFLLLVFSSLACSDTLHQIDVRDGDVQRLPCVLEKSTLKCHMSEANIESSQKTQLEVVPGQMVEVHLRSNSSKDSMQCFWEHRETSNLFLFKFFEKGMDDIYTVVCGNRKSVNVSVHIHSTETRPSVPELTTVRGKKYESARFRCVSEGNPKPTITWYENEKHRSQGRMEISRTEKGVAESKMSSLEYSRSNIKCCAKNSHGEECSYIYHYDLDTGREESEASEIWLRRGQSLSLRCKVTGKPAMPWYFNNDTKLTGLSEQSYEKQLEYYSIASVSQNNSGEYHCNSSHGQRKAVKVHVFENDFLKKLNLSKHITIQNKDRKGFCFRAEVPSHLKAKCQWVMPNGSIVPCEETQHLSAVSTFTLCDPEPGQYQILLRSGREFTTGNMSLCVTDLPKFQILHDLTHVTCMTKSNLPVHISWMTCPSNANYNDTSAWKETYTDSPKGTDSGQFCQKTIVVSRPLSDVNDHFVKCCWRNNNTDSHCSEQILVKISSVNYFFLVGACILAWILTSVLVLFLFIRKKKPGYETQIQMIQMVGPLDNDYIYIDFKDFKYNQKLEFPRENLELGKELGSGAFGMVVQATAYGISKPGVSMQVAVKMLKEKHQAVEKEALMSELKMLMYIGNHTNIVNLLGACTGTGPIYLIFQYCHYGDLLNYLKNNREHFYKSLTDAFNKDRFRSLYNNYQRKRNSSDVVQSGENPYMPMSPVNKEQESLLGSTDVNEDFFESGDEEDHQTLTYEDLLSFSYQVAKGMEFLSAKNCIHRDLAARNILVTRSRLVKIGDFGLARDIENDSNYVVRGNARLPVKWMAPESIFKGMYTMQSDVWAYGILLWEIFSLGVTPYPGIKVDNTFYAMIERGFKMERPYYASESVYKVMCHCWALEPQNRPCFSKLVAFMEYQLSEFEEQLYYNVEGQKKGDSVYQNTPVIPESQEIVKEDEHQSSVTDSPCGTETADSENNMETITYL